MTQTKDKNSISAFVQLLRRIEVPVKEVKWSDNGELVALITETAFYTLQFSQAAVDDYIESGQEIEEDGIEEAFEFLNEVQDRVRTGNILVCKSSYEITTEKRG